MIETTRAAHARPSATSPPVPILIVDDDASKRLGLKAVLQPLGYSIVEADSGLAALRSLMSRDFAVILLDVRMPIMDGFETARADPTTSPVRDDPDHLHHRVREGRVEHTDLYAEGAVDFIFAPVPANELRAKVSVFANLFIRAEQLATQAREVQLSADRLRLLTDAAPIGIFQTDAGTGTCTRIHAGRRSPAYPAGRAAGQAMGVGHRRGTARHRRARRGDRSTRRR